MAKLILGCGYLGVRVARRWIAAGDTVWALTRSARRADELAQQGMRTIVADLTAPFQLSELGALETVLFSVGFDRSAGQSIDEVYVGGLKNALAALPAAVDRLIYISSTGVYGETDGGWVDEDTPPRPLRAGARAHLAAEQALAAHPLGRRGMVLRLAGIYGPGRIPNLDKVRAGQPITAAASSLLNLIHVDDAAEVVLAAERRGRPPACYVVSDGSPVRRADFYGELARLVGAEPPRFEPPPASADRPPQRRAGSDRRVRNARMRTELAAEIRYPSFREGLAAVVRAEPA